MKHEKHERNLAVIETYREVKNLRATGRAHGISHERVRQIISRVPGLLAERRGSIAKRGVTKEELAKLLAKGLSSGEMCEALSMSETNLRIRVRSAGLRFNARRRARA